MKANDKGVTGSECGSTKGAASAQNGRGELVVGGAFVQLDLQQPLALRGPDLLGLAGMGNCLLAGNLHLVGDDELRLGDVLGSQELLGALTAGSRLAVVVPGDHLLRSSLGESGLYRMRGQEHAASCWICGSLLHRTTASCARALGRVVLPCPHASSIASTMGRAHAIPGR